MNTNRKRITVFNGREIERHSDWPEADECTHINSIWSPNGDKFYVMEHNGCNPPSTLVLTDENLNPVHEWVGVGRDCHCIYIEGDELITASSREFGM